MNRISRLLVIPMLLTFMLSMAVPSFASDVMYQYDSLGRVTSVTYVQGTTTKTIQYNYDKNGNLESVTMVTS